MFITWYVFRFMSLVPKFYASWMECYSVTSQKSVMYAVNFASKFCLQIMKKAAKGDTNLKKTACNQSATHTIRSQINSNFCTCKQKFRSSITEEN